MKILAITLALMIPQITMARMGETIEQCDKRYGVPTEKTLDDQSRTYRRKGIRIECFFDSMPRGKCVHIKYSPINSSKLARTLWESNHPAWRSVEGGDRAGLYRKESLQTDGYDDMLAWYIEGESLRIDSLPYHESNPNPNDPDIRKKIISGAVDQEDLEHRGQEGEKLSYTPESQTPYTGWVSRTNDNREFSLSRFKNGKRNGLYISWYPSGRKHHEYYYIDDKENGLTTCWHENGKKDYQFISKNGKPHGLYTTWYENGKKWSETNYKDDLEHGSATEWYESGKKKYVYSYENGKLHGLCAEWHENGEKWTESNFKRGKEHGLSIEWDERGKKVYQDNYNDGELVD